MEKHKRLRHMEGTAQQRKQARAEAKAEEMREHHSQVRVAHSAAFGPRSNPRIDNPFGLYAFCEAKSKQN